VKSPGLKRLINGLLQSHAPARRQALDAAQLRCGQSDGEYGDLLACWHACTLTESWRRNGLTESDFSSLATVSSIATMGPPLPLDGSPKGLAVA